MPVKSKVKISKNFVAFSEYMNFMKLKYEYDEYKESMYTYVKYLWIYIKLFFIDNFSYNAMPQ